MSQVLPPITFFKRGDTFHLGIDAPSQRFEKLPAGLYLVCISLEGYFLKELPPFELPKRIYGDIEPKADRILRTFDDRPKTTGCLFSGEKGSGKTLLTKTICNKAIVEGDMPVLVVNNAFSGDSFNTFLQAIQQPCVLLFDEFEKVYDDDSQKDLLTLFDGIFTTKKLILLTSNEYLKVNTHLQNRPGRIYYNLEFNGLDHNFILEYGQENMKNKSFIDSLAVVASMLKPISFDILQSIVEECDRYNENPIKVLDMLNVKAPRYGYADNFDITEFKHFKQSTAKPYKDDDDHSAGLRLNPWDRFAFNYQYKKVVKGKNATQTESTIFGPENLVQFDGIKGIYKYKNDEAEITLTRKEADNRTKYERYEHLGVKRNADEDIDY